MSNMAWAIYIVGCMCVVAALITAGLTGLFDWLDQVFKRNRKGNRT